MKTAYYTIVWISGCIALSTPLVCGEEPEDKRSKAISALQKLEERTGRTAEELLPAIEIYSSMLVLLSEDLESGAVKKEELTDFKVIAENQLTAMREDTSTDAMTKLIALRSLNTGDADRLTEWLRKGIADYYASILNRENKTATAYRGAVEREAAKDPKLAEAIAHARKEDHKAQQGGAEQPATRPELKSDGSDKPQPEAEGRSR
jgi:hypothetical protein